jgi:predicted porin
MHIMKKLILAVAISSLAAGSVNAATLYEKDGLTYKMNGDFQIQLRQNVGEDQNPYVDFDDLEIKNYISYDLGNDMTAFGRLDLDFKGHANDGATDQPIEEAYVGMQYRMVSGSIGRQNFAGDEFGVQAAYEAPLEEDRFDAEEVAGDDTLSFSADLGNVFLLLTHELKAENKPAATTTGRYTDLFVSTELAGLTLAAAYQTQKPIGLDSVDTYGVSASYDFGIASLGADYSSTDNSNTDVEASVLNVAATFDFTNTTGVAVGMQQEEEDGSEDLTGWYANVTYKFPSARNVSTFAEVSDTDADNDDMGFLAGMRVQF